MLYNTSSILERLLEMFSDWSRIFPSSRTHRRAMSLALGSYMNMERKTITNAKKTGRKIPHTQRYRDPMSPPFHVNLLWGQRFLQISGLIPSGSIEKGSSRGIPTMLRCCPRPQKPGRKASVEDEQEYKAALERHKLSRVAVAEVRDCRERLDRLGGRGQVLLMVGDGAFANKEIYAAERDRVAWLCRTRKDMAVYYPWSEKDGTRKRKYGKKAPTPEELRAEIVSSAVERFEMDFEGFASENSWTRSAREEQIGTRGGRLSAIGVT